MPKGFIQALNRHSAEAAKLEGAQAQEFLRLLKELERELGGRLLTVGGDQLDYSKYLQIDGETKAAIATLERKLNGQYGAASAEAADLAIEHISDELDRLSLAFDNRALDVSLDASMGLADPGQLLLANHFETSVRRYGLDVLNQVRRRVLIGIRTGDAPSDVARSIVGPRGALQGVPASAGQRLIRTEVSNAYGSAVHSGIKQASKAVPALKKVWLHVGSYRCETCGPLNGTERPLDGTWTIRSGRKAIKVSHPPGHPNCTCRVSAMKPGWRAGLEKLGYLEPQGEGDDAAL